MYLPLFINVACIYLTPPALTIFIYHSSCFHKKRTFQFLWACFILEVESLIEITIMNLIYTTTNYVPQLYILYDHSTKVLSSQAKYTVYISRLMVWLALFWCPCMAINVSAQYNGGFLPDIIMLTLCDSTLGNPFNTMERFCPYNQFSHLNLLTGWKV